MTIIGSFVKYENHRHFLNYTARRGCLPKINQKWEIPSPLHTSTVLKMFVVQEVFILFS